MNVRRTGFLVALPVLSVLAATCGSGAPEPRTETTPAPAAPAAGAQPAQSGTVASREGYAGELPPLPALTFPAARPVEVVNAAYEFAARRPDVLRYVPCFCGCERDGHMHNEHCFVASRDSTGKPRWDAHGMG